MIKYPLYVTLDTNIFDANKLDFSQDSTLGLLINHVKAGKIKIVLSNIVLKEVEKHIIKASDGVCSSFRGLRKDLINGVSDKFLEEIGIKTDLLMLNKEEYRTKSLEMWKKFLKKLNPEILNLSLVDLDGIVSDYFAINPPFESSEKKRKEFPDAFIANQIRKRFCENEVIAIISDDKGLKKACGYSENHIFYQSLGELYNAINRQEREYKEIVRIINSLIGRYFSEIEEKIKNEDCLEVHGLSCDSDGIESGYDYSDAEVVSIRGISSRVRSIDEIKDETAWATLLCAASIDVVCSYEDYDNRKYVNDKAVAEKIESAGYDPYEKKVIGITAMTKMLGKTKFEELLSGLIEKSQGKPTLVPMSDKCPAMKNTTINGFKEDN